MYLSERQRQAVELFLYQDMLERDVARRMGVSPANPVAIYATQGLKRLAAIYESGFEIPAEPVGPGYSGVTRILHEEVTDAQAA